MEFSKDILKSFEQKESLSSAIWQKNSEGDVVLKKPIRKKLILAAKDFIDFIGVDDLKYNIKDITITGSIANYNWSKYSDIDLHLIVDFDGFEENEELLKNIFNTKKNLWNSSHDVKVKGHDVEVYIQDEDESHFSSGVYSVLFDKWLVQPKPTHIDVDFKVVEEKSRQWMDIIDDVYKSIYDKNPNEVIEDIDKIKNKLKKFRSSGLDKNGEYSYENLVFKFLRRNGYLKKLFSLKNKLVDYTLSIY